MEYMPVKQAANKWGVSTRWIQTLLKDNRINGAIRVGRDWMIPAATTKPGDIRREKNTTPVNPLAADLAYVIEAVYIPAPRHDPDGILSAISDARLKILPEMGLAYARGDFARLKDCYYTISADAAVKLCACPSAIAAAISLGDYSFYLEIENYLKDHLKADISDSVSAFAELVLASAYLGAMAPSMTPAWLKDGDFTRLLPPVKLEAAYQRAKYFQSLRQYESMLAVAQTALSFCHSAQWLSFPYLYLRLICAVACHALNRLEEAEQQLLEVMHLSLPHGIITPFAELLPQFGGLMELCLKRDFPEYYDVVFRQCRQTFTNWISFHNHFAKDNIALILSIREYEMVQLVARGMPYAEIAEKFNISVGRFNNIMQEICGKLCVSGKKELVKYFL
jgi:DNA-binding CsgD family transcriptional regulator